MILLAVVFNLVISACLIVELAEKKICWMLIRAASSKTFNELEQIGLQRFPRESGQASVL